MKVSCLVYLERFNQAQDGNIRFYLDRADNFMNSADLMKYDKMHYLGDVERQDKSSTKLLVVLVSINDAQILVSYQRATRSYTFDMFFIYAFCYEVLVSTILKKER